MRVCYSSREHGRKLQPKAQVHFNFIVQEPASASKQQSARKLPATLAKSRATPQKEPASKPVKPEKSQTPSKQRPSAAKGKRKAVNLLEDDDDEDDFQVILSDMLHLQADYSVITPSPQEYRVAWRSPCHLPVS